MSQELATAPITEFEIVPDDLGLAPAAKHSLELSFASYFQQAARWKEQAELITSPKLARAARLEIKSLRVAAEKKRKELKEESMRYGKAVDGANNILLALIVPIEERLEEIEKAEERRIAAENEARGTARCEQLTTLGVTIYSISALAPMAEADFGALLADAKSLHEARIERERKAEEERLAKEVAEAKERERIRLDNERLLREAAEREEAARVEREKAEAERKALEAKLASERKEAEAKAAAEAAKVRAEKEEAARAARELLVKAQAAAEAQRREAEAKRAELERKAAEDRSAREKIEAEAKAARDAEELKARQEAEAAEAAALAPDREKLTALAEALRTIPLPSMATKKGKTAIGSIGVKLEEFRTWIEKKAATL